MTEYVEPTIRRSQREIVEYIYTCPECGKEDAFGGERRYTLCYRCKDKETKRRNDEKIKHLIGATILKICLEDENADELRKIIIQTKDGKKYKIDVYASSDESYMEIEEIECQE